MEKTDTRPWHKHYPDGMPLSIDYPDLNMVHYLEEAAIHFPQRTAIIFNDVQISYSNLVGMVNKFATALHDLGVGKGDRVAIMSPNSPHYVVGYYAVQKLGAIVVQVNPMYMERELEHILNDSGAVAILAYDALYPRIKNIRAATSLKDVILFSLGQPADCTDESVLRAEKLMAQCQARPPAVEFDVVNDVAVLQYTGGTTGISKGAMLTHRNVVANALQTKAWFMDTGSYGKETVLCVLPFFHAYGVTVALNFGIVSAATLVILPRFDINQVLQVIDKYQPTQFPGAPTMYISFINHPDVKKFNVKSIRNCISGSAPLPVEVAERFEELTEGNLVEGYGLSETSPVTNCNPVAGLRKVGSIGIPFPDTDCKIIDLMNSTVSLPPNQVGELCVKGPQVMKGYWNMPEETDRVLRDGWLHTGDIAKVDEDGFFYIVDRKKDMINASGFNVYPREVEEVLFEHPKILEAVVIGVPDPYRGETVKAFVVLKEGLEATPEEIINYCRAKMAGYKVPRQVEFRKDLPKTAVGKILKRQLKAESLKQT